MNGKLNRREFFGGLSAGLGLASTMPLAFGAPQRRLKAGHTGITWSEPPQAVHDIAELGFYGYETFGDTLEAWEQKGGLKETLETNHLPLISAYCNVNLTDSTKRKDEVDKIVRWATILKKYGGVTAVVGPNPVKRPAYDFKASKSDIVASLNDVGHALTDMGITAALHQHTGTCIEYRDEVYAVLDSMDTRYMKFGPDVGQLAKGGSDPVKVVTDYLPLIRHVHLKDWDGGQNWQQYCPLGKGKVNVPAIVDLLEKSQDMKIFMVELDSSRNPPLTPFEAARTSREYLKTLGYTFRS